VNRYQYGRRYIEEREKYRRWIDPRVWNLPLAQVVAYLRQHGWMEVPPDREGCLVFREPASTHLSTGQMFQFVPASEQDDYYPQGMFELVTGLADFEQRSAADVIDDILQAPNASQTNGAAGEHATGSEKRVS